jgi:Signal peptide peptidase
VPGYLIAFCARLDEAKRIIGKHTSREMEYTEKWFQGSFFWLMVAYSVGLALAFTAFALTEVGQPALLYIVPCCLGMICIVGRKELKDLWTGTGAVQLALKLQNRYERAWGREQMRRDVAEAKRERGEGDAHHPYRSSDTGSGRDDRLGVNEGPGRDSGGRGGRHNRSPSAKSSGEPTKSPSSQGRGFVPPPNPHSPGRHSAALDDNRKRGSSMSKASEKPSHSSDAAGPKENDVCFRRPNNTGVKHLRTVIRRELKSNPKLEFGPIVLESIRKRLPSRGFYVPNGAGGWRAATSSETAQEISKLFRAERALAEKNKSERDRN